MSGSLLGIHIYILHFFTQWSQKKIPVEADAFSKGLKESKSGEQGKEWKQQIRVKFNIATEEGFYILVPNIP